MIREETLRENAERVGQFALAKLRDLQGRHSLVGDVRGLGLLLGVELVRDRQSLERATEEAEEVMYQALARGLSFKLTMGNILTLTPSLTVTEEEVTEAVDILDECLGLVS